MTQLPITELLRRNTVETVLIDETFRIVSLSDGAALLSDDPRAAVKDNDIRDAFPELVGMEHELLRVANGEIASCKLRGIARERGEPLPLFVDVEVTRQHDASAGKQLAVVLENATERMTVEQQLVQGSNEAKLVLASLAESNAYLERILDSMTDALCVTDPDGTIRTVNTSTIAILGYHRGNLLGKNIGSIMSDERFLPANGEHTTQNGGVMRAESVWRSKDNEQIPVAVTRSFVRLAPHGHNGMVYLARDLRTQKHAEARIVELRNEREYLREELEEKRNLQQIVGTSPAVRKVFEQIQRVARTDATVLLLGETGTGKELLAHAIHNLSARADRVLVKVNCAALPAGLVESELFGHEKGAFTGALSRRTGRFELAHGGTILLDELGELEAGTQTKLLRILQEQEFERVGGTQTLKVDVRVIAATNQDLQEKVASGTFRSDLFYRLNVFPVHVPPLRDRAEDLALLISYFVDKFAAKMNKHIDSVEEPVMEKLKRYRWPGNVRELANVMERAVILCDGKTLTDRHIILSPPVETPGTKATTLEENERRHILDALAETGGVIEGPNGAARKLSINPSTLRSRMKKLGIKRHGTSYS